MKGWISENLYKKIIKEMPVPCVDAVILDQGRVLLMKRNNPPVRGWWWIPGGRIRRGESLSEALLRQVKEETGLDIEIIRLIDVYSLFWKYRHDVAVTYLVKKTGGKLKLNSEHSDFRWISDIPANVHDHIKKVLKDSKAVNST